MTTYKDILRQVETLSQLDRLRLLEALAEVVQREKKAGSQPSILELAGLGKEIWQGIDAQTYVDRERDAWSS